MTWVLWNGNIGGAETLAVGLATAARREGYDARILFIQHSGRIGERLEQSDVPYSSLVLERGRHVVFHPRRLAAGMGQADDCAVLVSPGYLAASARLGGFRGAIIAVEHGTILQAHSETRGRRIVGYLDRRSGVWACDAEVAVSPFALEALRRLPHARRLTCIPNGVDTKLYAPGPGRRGVQHVTVGCASRLAPGKGVDDLLRAFALLNAPDCVLRIAGDGPEITSLVALASELNIHDRVEFLGELNEVPAFWKGCDIAVVPSNQSVESFGMAAVEAMATGVPVVATSNGGLASVVLHDVTGLLVMPGDVGAIAGALSRYARDPTLRDAHGQQGRQRTLALYDVNRCAMEYVELARELNSGAR